MAFVLVAACVAGSAVAGGNAGLPAPPNRVIVKFSSRLAADIESDPSPDAQRGTGTFSRASVRQWLLRHRIVGLQPLYDDLVRKKREAGTTDAGHARSVQARFPARARRHPGGCAWPGLSRTYLLTLRPGPRAEIDDEMRALKLDPDVEFAEAEHLYAVQLHPDDPFFLSTGLLECGCDLYGVHLMNCPPAWDLATGSGVVVAVVDTGIDFTHPDIAANIWTNAKEDAGNGVDEDRNGYVDDVHGWNFIGASFLNPTQDNNPVDRNGHGTHISGTIAALGGNRIGVVGVAFNAQVMPLKAMDDDGYGTDSSLAAAIRYAADNGADVINNSWGGPGFSSAIDEALRYAYGLGVVIVSSAGNSSADVCGCYPASSPCTITVSAYDNRDHRACFSNFGSKIDVAAPGVDILSLLAANTHPGSPVGAQYALLSGTSAAAPHVAGLAALILSANPGYTQEQVRQAIRLGAVNVDGLPIPDFLSGYGCIDAFRSLSLGTTEAAKILSPASETRLTTLDKVGITGIASGPTFSSYVIEVGFGDVPTLWTTIARSSMQVVNGPLATLDPGPLQDGRWSIRLTVTDASDARFQDKEVVIVDRTANPAPVPRSRSIRRRRVASSLKVA